MLGNMRINLISRLRSTDGDTLKLSTFSRLDISDDKKELSMLFRPIYGDAADFEGGIENFFPLCSGNMYASLFCRKTK